MFLFTKKPRKSLAYPLTLLLLFMFSMAVRFFYLDRVPIGVVSDNINFVLHGKAIFYTGRDMSGQWSPWHLTPVPYEFPQAEIPYALFAPVVGPLPLSPLHAHILPVIVNSVFVVLLSLLTYLLIGKYQAIVVGFIAMINPWFFIFGRTAYEAPIALFFLFLFFFLLFLGNKISIILSFLPFVISFLTYSGLKLILGPIGILAILYSFFFHKKKLLLYHGALLFMIIGWIVFFAFHIQHSSSGNRLSEVGLSMNQISHHVNVSRHLTIENPFMHYATNKFTASVFIFFERFLGVYAPQYLFLSNESSPRFRFWQHGYFYLIDALFLFVGLTALLKKKRLFFLFLVGILLLAPFPAVMSNNELSYSQRASLVVPCLIIAIGVGIYECIDAIKRKILKIVSLSLVGVIYGVHFLYFLYLYFFIYPITSAEGMAFSERILSNYVHRTKENGSRVVVVSTDPKNFFKAYLFYNNIYTREYVETAKKYILKDTYDLGNPSFLRCEEVTSIDPHVTYIFDPEYQKKCPIISSLYPHKTRISQLSDGGTIFVIANDSLCNSTPLNNFPRGIHLNDFLVESLSNDRFCKTFISQFPRLENP